MTEFIYEKQAKENKPMVDNLELPEQWCWQAIALLTGRYRYGLISASEAAKELALIKKQFSSMMTEVKYIHWTSQLWRNVEGATRRFNEEPTLDNAFEMRKAIYGDVFKKTEAMLSE